MVYSSDLYGKTNVLVNSRCLQLDTVRVSETGLSVGLGRNSDEIVIHFCNCKYFIIRR